jgi:hypothetical protein
LSAFCRKTVSPKSALRWRRIWHAISRAVTILKAAKTNRVYALLAKSPVFAGLVAHPLAMALADKRLRKDRSRRGFSAVESAATHRPWKSAVSNMGDGVLVYFGYPQAHEDDAGLTAVGRPQRRVLRSKQLAKLASGGIGDKKAARHCETLRPGRQGSASPRRPDLQHNRKKRRCVPGVTLPVSPLMVIMFVAAGGPR